MAAKILNVDDKEINRYVRTQILASAGYQVVEADGGERALELCRSLRPELVLLDVNMPDLGGSEVCRRIKNELGGDKPVIVLHISATATASDDFIRGLDGGADGYLAEPVRPELLLATVRSMLRAYRAEEALRQRDADLLARTRELAESNENLERFAYVVAHELQTPLRNIGSLTQLLAARLKDSADSELRELMGLIVSGVERGRSLIQGLLDYSQVTGDARARIGPVDANAQAEAAVASLRTVIEETRATVVIDRLPEVLADEQLSRVFQNLIENAIKYRSEADPYVHVTARRSGDYWQFAVSDNGMGFEMKYAETIFGVFRRLHGQAVEGTGIGLAVCRRLMERYGGRIWAESAPGQGSTFYFMLRAVTTLRP